MNPLKEYFNKVSDKLTVQADLSGTLDYRPDIGSNRENILIEFLNKHCPNSLKAYVGGQLIGYKDPISKQIDIIVVNHLFPKFEENAKTFAVIESVASVISVKSHLDTNALEDCLLNIASIPQIDGEILSFNVPNGESDFWVSEFLKKQPSKFIFAYTGMSMESCYKSIIDFYKNNKDIPDNRIPNQIIVNNSYTIKYSDTEITLINGEKIPPRSFYPAIIKENSRGYALAEIINHISLYMSWLPYMRIEFHKYLNDGFEFTSPNTTLQGTAHFVRRP